MLREILQDKNGHEYIVEGIMGFGRYTVCGNWEFWSVVDNKKEFDEEVEQIKRLYFAD